LATSANKEAARRFLKELQNKGVRRPFRRLAPRRCRTPRRAEVQRSV